MSLGAPRKQLGPAIVTVPSQYPFVDHASTEGLSAYIGKRLVSLSGSDDKVLPPLFSFQVYVTYGPTLAHAPSYPVPDFVSRAMADMNKHGQFEYPIRFDFHFLPGKDVDDVISHYHAEGKALPDYSKRPGDSFRGVAVLLSRESWETEGVDLVLFNPPAEYLQGPPAEREAILEKGVRDDGILKIIGVSVQPEEWNNLSVRLRTLAESNQKWGELKDEYDEAVLQAKTEW
ncbi:hypothetical protein VPNG_06297 [Cytospora leucostoma]|uniref:Uncharacterized protein n=1 Tax=Cytospora leucostoma TaxID=1230097 RepID=A0A423X241_9PEZI|nr:hypothetical protein VPNG_06297 [Cytospora leucostoma]